MRKTFVLMRHGKALPAADGQQDIERPLSEAGRRALRASLPNQLAMLDKDDRVSIWSSPALRAQQSAELLECALGKRRITIIGGIEEHPSLWDQDEAKFLSELRDADEGTVFAVGHNPFVESLAKNLTGAEIPCATGGLVCLSVEYPDDTANERSDSAENARLPWFSQGPVSQRWKTLVQLENTMRKAADTVEAKRDAFFENPDDIETLHKFRVSIRTLRSLIAFVKPWQNAQQNSETQALLREIVGYTSKQRELDVFAQQARESAVASEELAGFCEGEAACHRKRVLSALESKRLAKKLQRGLSLARSITWKKGVVQNGLADSEVRERFDALVSSLEDELAVLRLSEFEHTHDVRKRAKRARYAAENFKEILGEDAVDIAKGMTSHQDSLGAVCDARVNIALINEFLKRDVSEHVSWELTLLRAQNETFLYSALRDDAADEPSAQQQGD